jgi:hypothetical protein
MGTKYDDQLALAHLSLIDMERVQRSIEYLRGTEEMDLKAALFRDAVVSYAKPFSSNRYSDQTKGLRISSDHVPKEQKALHDEILALRDELIAHTDMPVQNPKIEKYQDEVGQNYSMSVSGYETIHKEHLIEPLLKLAKAVHGSLIGSRPDHSKNDLP